MTASYTRGVGKVGWRCTERENERGVDTIISLEEMALYKAEGGHKAGVFYVGAR